MKSPLAVAAISVGLSLVAGVPELRAQAEWQEPYLQATELVQQASQEWQEFVAGGMADGAKRAAIVDKLKKARGLADVVQSKGAPESVADALRTSCDQMIQVIEGQLPDGSGGTAGPGGDSMGWVETWQKASAAYQSAIEDWSAYLEGGKEDPARVAQLVARLEEVKQLASRSGTEGAPEADVAQFLKTCDEAIEGIRTQKPDAIESFEVLRDRSEMGYRLRAPEGWEAVDGGASVDAVIRRAEPTVTLTVVVVPCPEGLAFDDAVLDAIYAEVALQMKEPAFVAKAVAPFRGKASGWIEYTARMDPSLDEPTRNRQIFAIHGTRLYIVTIGAAASTWDEALEAGQPVLDQVEFVD